MLNKLPPIIPIVTLPLFPKLDELLKLLCSLAPADWQQSPLALAKAAPRTTRRPERLWYRPQHCPRRASA